ncbi:aldehyde dehydrogenase family protein [Allorhizobium taibaishanense]|uniref:Aldehyde dehydrogenase n=1 Tax=Allorhizobium taibaishanense TaxID=887144 RepID=A0A1Q9A4W5_9HYPH|nr:aldehyde dehydrogenase family protein [Allorhizobium taibaishanense]MBB4006595.1 aldehyde dehydrogenase (NAD+) [Allorhizobium taibaishanense]OLP49517.1 aldehyde dehydrogenase [Allorhizobium taibaishanense]
MSNHLKFFIDGAWVDPVHPAVLDVIDPSTEEAYTQISVGTKADVDKAVAAAKRAFASFSQWPVAERLALLNRILDEYNRRYEDIAQAVSREMGAPLSFARDSQAWAGRAHMEATIAGLETFKFSEQRRGTMVVKEPIGVCALITPWNWPLNQIVCKVAPALAAGCTVVLKPSEIAPISGIVFSEVMEAAGVPQGVYNMVSGNGPDVGQVMAGHPDVDMVSFTGSTRAGIIVAKTAAETVKRVAQELGGKSANIVLPDADFETAVRKGVQGCFGNSGQSCDAPTRMLVPADRHDEALAHAKAEAETFVTGDPRGDETQLGPVVSQIQYDKIQRLIEAGIKEGAVLVTGGLGRPEGLNRGYYIRPTVFGNVSNDMTIAREEIFGPVLSILPYKDEAEAVEIANDTVYGLAAYVQSTNIEHARDVAKKMRAGSVYLNYPDWDTFAPFGGYKQSGNGREYADWAIHDFLEIKGVVGWEA